MSAGRSVQAWARGYQLATRRADDETAQTSVDLGELLDRIDELRDLADELGARPDERADDELEFYRTWARLQRPWVR